MPANDEPEPSQALVGEVLPPDPDAIELGRRDRRGRPSSMTIGVVDKLIAAFKNGYNITEACMSAGIDRSTYYSWLASDDNFSYKMSKAQGAPTRKAKRVVIAAINDGDVNSAKWWLNAKDPEFKSKVEGSLDPGVVETRLKIKEFLDDTSSFEPPTEPDVTGGEPPATDTPAPVEEVPTTPSDIS